MFELDDAGKIQRFRDHYDLQSLIDKVSPRLLVSLKYGRWLAGLRPGWKVT